jgi:hypothetical protein
MSKKTLKEKIEYQSEMNRQLREAVATDFDEELKKLHDAHLKAGIPQFDISKYNEYDLRDPFY